MKPVEQIHKKFNLLGPLMDERMTRLWAASEALAFGHGGVAAVTNATGILGKRIIAGKRDLEELAAHPPKKAPGSQGIRRPGGGRKRLEDSVPDLLPSLNSLVDPVTRGDPESPLRWTTKSTQKLSDELKGQGFSVSPNKVRSLLKEQGYSLQGNAKTREGNQHPDRNAQFEYINRKAKAFHSTSQPVISVDTKKKELIGDFKNGGREWQPKGEPVKVRTHDFIDKTLGKAVPYGVYDILRNEGWVNVGISHDTAEFSVESIRRWWKKMGRSAYPDATELMITADSGGSNGSRIRLWKTELQQFADETGLRINICHYPPGTSKWNKIEHRLFSHITQNWRGRPLESIETIVNLIGATTTEAGLKVNAVLDDNHYEKGIKVTDDELQTVNLKRSRARGQWNYIIESNKKK